MTRKAAAFATMGLAGAFAHAGTLTVTAPTTGGFLGRTNTLTFNLRGARVQANVRAVITGPSGVTTVQGDFTPNIDGEVAGSLPLTFNPSSPQGEYSIQVSVTEPNNPYTPVTVAVNVDTVLPRILDFSPLRGSFVRGIVPIRFRLRETNIEETRVTVGGQAIPNGTGTTNNVEVPFDTSAIESDGPQTIGLVARDLANNELNTSINVTIDRNAPVATVQFPRGDTPIRANSDVTVIIDIVDQFETALDVTGVDVVVQRLDGVFITRASRLSFRNVGGNTFRWTGRLRAKGRKLPSSYKLVISAIDKAGNTAVRQEVTVRP